MKELFHLDLHRGLKSHEMDARPRMWKTIDDECCILRIKEVSFGGSLTSPEDEIAPSPTWKFAFGGLGRHPSIP
jgi:hypothetical protein